MIIHARNPKKSTKMLLELRSEFSKGRESKENIQKPVIYFCILLTNN